MTKHHRSLLSGVIGALLLCAAFGARAQDGAGNAAGPAIGPPQLKDFQLQPRERIVTQPPQPAPRPTQTPPPAPITSQPPAAAQIRPQARPTPSPAATAPRQPAQGRPAPAAEAAPTPSPPTATAIPIPVAQAPDQPGPAPATAEPSGFPWRYAIALAALAALALLGFVLLRRRNREEPEEPEVSAAIAAPAPRPEPAPRPWLELELKAERASATPTETIVQFELTIANTGEGPARNLRIDIKMFNASREQDEEIGAFFRTAGRESTKLNLPGIGPDSTGVISGEVTMPREEMKAVRFDEKLLFIPMIAVNALYDWGDGQLGQTSKSWLVGRELQQPSEKMGAFRVDLGPRIWRTIGQRQHKLARRV